MQQNTWNNELLMNQIIGIQWDHALTVASKAPIRTRSLLNTDTLNNAFILDQGNFRYEKPVNNVVQEKKEDELI